MFISDDLGASWIEITLDIPADPDTGSPACIRFLAVDSASLTADGFVVEIWGYQVSDDPGIACPDVESMRLVWSDGATTQLPGQRTDPTVIARDYDVYTTDNWFAVTSVDDVLRVQRVDNGQPVSTTASFEGLFPTWTLAAGQAGVAMTAFPSLEGQLEASTIGGLPVWRDFERVPEPTGVHLWLGWSTDGIRWGWQDLPDAFGITEGEPWAQLGVGRDFVIARVETITVPAPDEIIEDRDREAPALRWFIASVPQ